MKKRDLKKKGFGKKPNAAQPLEDDEVEKMWSTGAIGLQNPRSLFRLVWWNNVTHLGMRAFNEQNDFQLDDSTITEQYVEYKKGKLRTAKVTKKGVQIKFFDFCDFLLDSYSLAPDSLTVNLSSCS